MSSSEGILLVDKPEGITSFGVIAALRKHLGIQKIGHTGTLDPMATGLLVVLVGRTFTRLADKLQSDEKEYLAQITLGQSTTTYDREGTVTQSSSYVPTHEEVQKAICHFEGDILQIPPMFSAKKVAGKKLYELAREGKEIERKAQPVHVKTKIIEYSYPHVLLHVTCSKGTYIRSLAHDIGNHLTTHGHLTLLRRLRCGLFLLKNSYTLDALKQMAKDEIPFYESI